METPKPVAEMSDRELIDEWYWLIADAEDREERTTALAAEMQQRGLDF
jgi:hypothetical protein